MLFILVELFVVVFVIVDDVKVVEVFEFCVVDYLFKFVWV